MSVDQPSRCCYFGPPGLGNIANLFETRLIHQPSILSGTALHTVCYELYPPTTYIQHALSSWSLFVDIFSFPSPICLLPTTVCICHLEVHSSSRSSSTPYTFYIPLSTIENCLNNITSSLLSCLNSSVVFKMAPKPVLQPLELPKNMSFPSELREQTSTIYLDTKPKERDTGSQENTVTITPPPAYTEFLETFSPIFASSATSRASFAKYMSDKPRRSPTSVPSSTTSSSFSKGSTPKHSPSKPPFPLSPAASWSPKEATVPVPAAKRLRLPPPYVYSPTTSTAATGSPRSAHLLNSPFSPEEWKLRSFESPMSEGGPQVCVRQIVTTRITYKHAHALQLDPPPPGKRRRNPDHR